MIPILLHLGKIPKTIPEDMEKAVEQLKKTKSKEECLEKAYKIVSSKHRGCRIYTFSHFFSLFRLSPKWLWNKKKCMHCTSLDYLLMILLLKSGKFKKEDFNTKWTLVWYFSPHQYLQVKIGNKKINTVDLWSKAYGIAFNDYAHGFH